MGPKLPLIPGFQFAGLHCGIKDRPTPDLALIYSEVPAVAAGTFTQHPAAAAPVVLSRGAIRCGKIQAVIINSGNANAGTGRRGITDAQAMVRQTAAQLRIPASRVLVCSTGVIGVPLPRAKVLRGIRRAGAALQPRGLAAAARAILTTDQGPKVVTARGRAGGRPYRVAAFAKGAGMIEPHMALAAGRHATMLAFIVTDLALEPRWARQVLVQAVEPSFNRISVDGDTSTNDTCLLLANGRAGNRPLRAGSPGAAAFARTLRELTARLAHRMVADGEGATKVVRIQIRGARHERQAQRLAYGIANSQLVRTSFYGADPNWGRVMAAAGNADATCRPERLDIFYGGVCLCRRGIATGETAQRKARRIMRRRTFTVAVDCHQGAATYEILSSDLSLKYVKLNSHYRS